MEQIRTFIAIELEEPIRAGLARVQEQLTREPAARIVRWTRPGGIHLTLKFLGDVPARRIEEIGQALERACVGFAPFPLTVGGLGCFPDTSRPRVVWVGVQEESESLARLQEAVEREVAPLGFPTEKRGFSPHLTLGRVKGASPGEARRLGELIHGTEIGSLGQMSARAVSLMRSDLHPSGAVYTSLRSVALEGP
jgi:2'-5' RNA ligase